MELVDGEVIVISPSGYESDEVATEFAAQLRSKVGVLINPETRIVEVYRANQDTVTLQDGDPLSPPNLLPEWEVAIVDLWAPEFD